MRESRWIEDKASGTQLIQELIADGCHGVTRYQPDCEKIMRMHAQTAMIENGFELTTHHCRLFSANRQFAARAGIAALVS